MWRRAFAHPYRPGGGTPPLQRRVFLAFGRDVMPHKTCGDTYAPNSGGGSEFPWLHGSPESGSGGLNAARIQARRSRGHTERTVFRHEWVRVVGARSRHQRRQRRPDPDAVPATDVGRTFMGPMYPLIEPTETGGSGVPMTGVGGAGSGSSLSST